MEPQLTYLRETGKYLEQTADKMKDDIELLKKQLSCLKSELRQILYQTLDWGSGEKEKYLEEKLQCKKKGLREKEERLSYFDRIVAASIGVV